MSARVFAPVSIGAIELRNRLALAPVKTALGGTDGTVAARHIAYYRRRARGGVGLVIVEPLFVDPRGREHPRQLGAHADDMIAGLRELAAAIQSEGAKACAHLNHAGRAANPRLIGGPPEAPSAVACPATGATPEPMTDARIAEVLDAFGQAARRARDAGFDAVEVQLGLGYLAAQFLSPRTNARAGDYGCDGDNRWRFVDGLVRSVRGAIGGDLALLARISADEKVDGGLGATDAIALARRLQALGVHAVHVVTGSACDSPPWYYQHGVLPPGVNERLAADLRRHVSIPVIVAGRLGDPARIRETIGGGMADMVALGRPLVADPDLPRKMEEGREDEIMRCGSCLQGCLAKVKAGGPIGCIVNPGIGHEGEITPPPAAPGERIVVVGGGPAGMQAALEARLAGYEVTLFERDTRLGGQFALAGLPREKTSMKLPFNALVRAVERSGVDVRTGKEADADLVAALEPARVVIATGSRPVVPDVPGLVDPLTAEAVLTGKRATGPRVLILGGGLVGIELAEHLAGLGRTVVIVELLDEVARDMEAISRTLSLRKLQALHVGIHTGTRLVRIADGEAFVHHGDDEERSIGRFDSFLVAVGATAYDPLSRQLKDLGLAVDVIGDARRPGQVFDATTAGREVVAAMRAGETGRSRVG